jgi:GTP-binding protein HflX
VRRLPRKTFTVAASVKTGLGFDDFLSTLVDALSLRLKEVEVFVPYSQDDGLIAAIHSQGVVLELVYGDTGTRVRCRVPPALRARLVEKGFKVSKNK